MKRILKNNQTGNTIFGIIIGFVIVVIIIILLLSLVKGFGFGFGSGNGNGDGDRAINSETPIDTKEQTEKEIEKTSGETQRIDIAINGNDYSYENKKYNLDELITCLPENNENIEIVITHNNSSFDAAEKLIKKLNEMGYRYSENNADD